MPTIDDRLKVLTILWLESLRENVVKIIDSTPSGEIRNILTELNLVMIMVNEEIKKEEPISLFERISNEVAKAIKLELKKETT